MFFKKFDIISPPITLYFKGDSMHSSIFSGILTIVVYLIIFAFGIYYALEFIQKTNPTAFFFNRYIEDAGEFPLNSSSMFHYINFRNTENQISEPIDFDMIRIIGIEEITINNYPFIDLKKTPHWLYGLCNNETDTEGIGYLIESEEYFGCACIRKYFNPDTNQYYDTNNKNFKWPSVAHGMSNNDHIFYGIIVEKCKNDDLRTLSESKSCKNSDKINNYIYNQAITIYLIDHYSDVLNYRTPFRKYLYSVSNMIFPKYFTVNNMNFNPAIIKTHNGIILDNIVKELSYFFSQNEKVTMDEEVEVVDEEGNPLYNEEGSKIIKSTGIISSYYFWMQNRLQFYERNYKRLQDIMSDIGGLSRVVLIIAIFINTLVSNYIILLDTEDLALSINKNEAERARRIRPNIYRKINLLINPPKRQYIYRENRNINSINNNIQQQSSNVERFMKEDINIYQNNSLEYERTEKIKYIKRNNYINKKNFNIKDENPEDNKIEKIIEQTNKNSYRRRYEARKTNNLNEKNYSDQFTLEQKEEDFSPFNEKQNFNWFQYIKYMIYCSRNSPTISYYEEFRAKIISEESIIKNHLDLFQFFNSFETNKKLEYKGNNNK